MITRILHDQGFPLLRSLLEEISCVHSVGVVFIASSLCHDEIILNYSSLSCLRRNSLIKFAFLCEHSLCLNIIRGLVWYAWNINTKTKMHFLWVFIRKYFFVKTLTMEESAWEVLDLSVRAAVATVTSTLQNGRVMG